MTDQGIGRIVRELRTRYGWRQTDLAKRAHVSPSCVSRIERGLLRGLSLDRLRRVLEAVGARLDVAARWDGGNLDRLMNARHSAMHELVAAHVGTVAGWEIAPEVSFSVYGERGVIDLLAWHAASRTALIVELKTEIVDINDLMAKADQRRRLAPTIMATRGRQPARVAVWVIVAESRTNRRRLSVHRAVLRAAFPVDGRSMAAWLRAPVGAPAALSFLTNNQAVSSRTSLVRPQRVVQVRSRSRRTAQPGHAATGRLSDIPKSSAVIQSDTT